MINAVIVDDELLARKCLSTHIDQRLGWQVSAQAETYDEAYETIVKSQPDICFMDIDIIGGSGIQLARELSKNVSCRWVFTTAHSQFAIQAFDIEAFDYLLKPIDNQRLERMFDKFEQQFKPSSSACPDNLAVKSIGSVNFISCQDILWLKGASNYVELHCLHKMMLHRETLSSLEKKLDPRKFLRVHRSSMVNIDHIESLNSELGRYSLIQLTNGDEVKISNAYRHQLFQRLGLEH